MVVYAVRKFIKSCILSFFILLLSGQITLAQDSRIEVYEGRYIIQYKEGRVLPRQSTQIDARFDGVARSLKRSKNGKHALVRDVRSSKAQRSSVRNIITHNEQDSSDFCGQLLASDDNIASCEPEAVLRTEDLPNDSHYDQLWGLDKISAPAAWDETTGGNVIVAVLDTGVDHTHPDLAENMWVNTDEIPGNGIDDDGNGYVDDIYGYDFYNNDGDPYDDHSHGTHCAGTIGARGNNTLGVVGVSWNVKIMALKFLAASGAGSTLDAAEAVDYAVANGAKVLSMSFGGHFPSTALRDALQRASDAGVLLVAAAGNNARDTDVLTHYPSGFDSETILAIAATDQDDNIAWFSNFGATKVDIAAPGVSIYSTVPGGYAAMSGTSMATPHVAGLAALLSSYDPSLTALELKSKIMNSGDTLSSLQGLMVSSARINAQRTLDPNSTPGVGGGDSGQQISQIIPKRFQNRRAGKNTVYKKGPFTLRVNGTKGSEATISLDLLGPIEHTCELGTYQFLTDRVVLRGRMRLNNVMRYTSRTELHVDESSQSVTSRVKWKNPLTSAQRAKRKAQKAQITAQSESYQEQAEAACDAIRGSLVRIK